MADLEREYQDGFQDVRRKQGDTAPAVSTPATYDNVFTLRTYLAASTAHGSGFYTTAKLNNMTKNDMIYAARLIQDTAGVK